ncbi:hypothetical protein KKG81_04505 [bacterium]|nr:hypothetical protein [bacterium]
MSKVPYKTLMLIGWVLTMLFAYLAFYFDNPKINNIFSDAFGAALSIVLIYSISWVVLKVKKIV